MSLERRLLRLPRARPLGDRRARRPARRGGGPALDGLDALSRPAPGRVLGLAGRTGSGKIYHRPPAGAGLRRDRRRGARGRRRRARRAPGPPAGAASAWSPRRCSCCGPRVRDNLTLFDPAVPDAALLEAIDALGLAPWLDALPRAWTPSSAPGGAGLSAGQAQLLALVRVFLEDPGLVVLDEASSRLDPATERLLEERPRPPAAGAHGGGHRAPPGDAAPGGRGGGARTGAPGRVGAEGPAGPDPGSRLFALLRAGRSRRAQARERSGEGAPFMSASAAPPVGLLRAPAPAACRCAPMWWITWRLITLPPLALRRRRRPGPGRGADRPPARRGAAGLLRRRLRAPEHPALGVWTAVALTLLVPLAADGDMTSAVMTESLLRFVVDSLVRKNLLAGDLPPPGRAGDRRRPGGRWRTASGTTRRRPQVVVTETYEVLTAAVFVVGALWIMARTSPEMTLFVFVPLVVVIVDRPARLRAAGPLPPGQPGGLEQRHRAARRGPRGGRRGAAGRRGGTRRRALPAPERRPAPGDAARRRRHPSAGGGHLQRRRGRHRGDPAARRRGHARRAERWRLHRGRLRPLRLLPGLGDELRRVPGARAAPVPPGRRRLRAHGGARRRGRRADAGRAPPPLAAGPPAGAGGAPAPARRLAWTCSRWRA